MQKFKRHFNYVILAVLMAGSPNIASAQNSLLVQKPASVQELDTYTLISIATFCKARELEIDFRKSMVVSVSALAAAFFEKHGALIEGNETKINEQQFVGMSSFNVVRGALRVCAKNVPVEEKEKYNLMLNEMEKRSKE